MPSRIVPVSNGSDDEPIRNGLRAPDRNTLQLNSSGFPVVDDQTMSPTSAADVAEIGLTVLRKGYEPDVYHTVNTGEVTRYGFERAILRQAGLPPDLVSPCTSDEFPTAAKGPGYSALQNQKIRSVVPGGM